MIEIRGEAWLLPTGGNTISPQCEGPIIRIAPQRVITGGIEAGAPWGRGRSVEGPPPDQSALGRAES